MSLETRVRRLEKSFKTAQPFPLPRFDGEDSFQWLSRNVEVHGLARVLREVNHPDPDDGPEDAA